MQDWRQGLFIQANWLFESNIEKHRIRTSKSYWPHSFDWRRLIQSFWRKPYHIHVFMQELKLNRIESVLWRTRAKNKGNDRLAPGQDGHSLPIDVQDILRATHFHCKTNIGSISEMGDWSYLMPESFGFQAGWERISLRK